jgi:adenylate cyclase
MEVAASRGSEIAFSAALVHAASAGGTPPAGGMLDGPFETRIRGRSGSIEIWLRRQAA